MRRNGILLVIVVLVAALLYGLLKVGGGAGGGSFVASAQRAVEAQGYTNVQYAGTDYLACGETAGFAFDADNANGVRVRLVACSPDGPVNYTAGWYLVAR